MKLQVLHLWPAAVKGHLSSLHNLRPHDIRGLDPDCDGVSLARGFRDEERSAEREVSPGTTWYGGLILPAVVVFGVFQFEIHCRRKIGKST